MKRLLYLLILPLYLCNTSCTMVVKGLAKSVAKNYDDHTDMNLSGLVLKDKQGVTQTFGKLFAGKTVYMYVWKLNPLLPPADKDSLYVALKRRFVKYDDVVFINLYNGSVKDDWQMVLDQPNKGVRSYQLADDNANAAFRELMGPSTSPQIIGKDGRMLSYLGPKPSDKLIVDYVLYEARSGVDGTKSAKELVKGINSDLHFKDPKLTEWYELHFGKPPVGKLSGSISGNKSNIGL
jgi:hypothetical protein